MSIAGPGSRGGQSGTASLAPAIKLGY